jgi:hypothetical protein
MNIPQFVLDEHMLANLRTTLKKELLEIKEMGFPVEHVEGKEQNWICFDNSGDLFSFSICEVNEKNAIGLKAASLVLITGPCARKNTVPSFKRFKQTLISLGALPLSRGRETI